MWFQVPCVIVDYSMQSTEDWVGLGVSYIELSDHFAKVKTV